MKKFLKLSVAALLALSLTFAFAACDEEEPKGGDETPVAVTGVTLDKAEATLKIGEEVTLTATVAPSDAADKTVTWTTSAATVATVTDGKVKAVATGTANITAKAGDKTAVCAVTVLKESNKITIGTQTYGTLAAAVAAAENGDIIDVTNGEYTVNETVTVDKTVTVRGEAGYTVIKTSGAQAVFAVTAENVVFDGISIAKTDKAAPAEGYAMFRMQANGFRVKNGTFTAQYADGDAEVTRAIVMNAGLSGYTLEGNTFKNIRQPAYLEGAGTVKDNYVDGTRGWVVCCNFEVTFTGNTFGANAVDIAIINNGQNVYDEADSIALSKGNDGAFVDNQVLGIQVKDGAKVTE